jgi:hypothetical protein
MVLASVGPTFPCRGGLPAPAAAAVTGHIQHQVQRSRDRQADRRPAAHIQRVVRPQIHPCDRIQGRQHERDHPPAARQHQRQQSGDGEGDDGVPRNKAQPGGMHPPQDRVRDRGPRPLPLDQQLDHPLEGELERHHQHQRGGQTPAPKRQRPSGDDQRHGEHPEVLEDDHRLVQPLGQAVDGVEGGPLDRSDPSVGGDHRADRERRQARHQHHDIAANATHSMSPTPRMPCLGTITKPSGIIVSPNFQPLDQPQTARVATSAAELRLLPWTTRPLRGHRAVARRATLATTMRTSAASALPISNQCMPREDRHRYRLGGQFALGAPVIPAWLQLTQALLLACVAANSTCEEIQSRDRATTAMVDADATDAVVDGGSHSNTVRRAQYSSAMQQTRATPPATLEAVLERITYANQETGYTVARVATNRSSDLLTVVGPLRKDSIGSTCSSPPSPGDHVQIGGELRGSEVAIG